MSKQDIEKRLGFAAQGVKATFAEFNVGDKVVATPNNHIDAYGRIIKIENGIATIASAEGNVKAKLSDLELVKKGSVEDLRRLGMKGFARPSVKAKMAALYSIEVVNGGSVTSTMDPEQFRAWAVKNVPGISQSDFVPTIIEKFNQMAKEKGMGTRVRIGNKRPGAKAKA